MLSRASETSEGGVEREYVCEWYGGRVCVGGVEGEYRDMLP